MVTKVEFYKKSRFIFLSLIFSFLFISCFNSFTPNPDTLSQPSERYVDISGRYSIDGALPKAIVESMYPDMQNDFSRSVDGAGTLYSAFPIIGTTNNIVEYYAFAKDANGVEQNVTGSVTLADKSFQIPHLKIGVYWIVEVGIKVKNTVAGTDTWIRCLYDISEPKTFTETDFTFNKTFLLKPDTSDRKVVGQSRLRKKCAHLVCGFLRRIGQARLCLLPKRIVLRNGDPVRDKQRSRSGIHV